MYYRRLTDIYNSMDLQELFPDISLRTFDEFIKNQVSNTNRYVSPYKFAYEQNITINSSVKFFIYFTGNTGIFDLTYYFECSRPSCNDNRIYLDINNNEEKINCEECGKAYKIQTVQRYIKALFNLKRIITLPIPETNDVRSDPNSTYEALRELPPHLKLESPSSSPEIGVSLDYDGGDLIGNDRGINVELLFNENENNESNTISQVVQDFKSKLLSLEV